MKTSRILLAAALLLPAAARAQSPTDQGHTSRAGHGIQYLPAELKAPVAAGVTDEELKRRQAAEKFGGFAAEADIPKGWDLESNSEFIAFGGNVTILPKGAILYVPERFKANVVTKMEGNLMLWPEFVARYPGLVARVDVTMEEVSGQKPFKADRLEAERKRNLILVGTYNQNPITVSRQTLNPQTPAPAR